MTIKIYNSLTKQREELVPIKENVINMYSCGVTVYDKCHIGHGRSLYLFEIISKYLRYRGYTVNFVRNITDIDDKIIKRANELGQTSQQVAEDNILKYKNDLKIFEINEADIEPRATENIDGMINHIKQLIEKGFAYEVDGDVYFKVREFKEYGKLSGQSPEKMLEAVRIDADAKKKDSLDFALWKKSKEGEPKYKSPWGDGRPGWHIECSVMSLKHLNCQTLDIHAGGRDLIFPHHENEIAQAESLTGVLFAKYWIHHGLLTIEGQKMAKSLGNFITIEDAVKKYPVNVIKMFFLSAHYSSAIDFSEQKLSEMTKAYDKVVTLFNNLKQMQLPAAADAGILKEFKDKFIEAMDDDFNTAKALAVLFDFITQCNKLIDLKDNSALAFGKIFLNEMLNVLGLKINEQVGPDQLPNEVLEILSKRADARRNKDFKTSDDLRDLLKEKGFLVMDSKDGQQCKRI